MKCLRLWAGCCLLALPLAGVQALDWPGLRDGALHLRSASDDHLQVSWQPAWQADANRERLYLQGGDGRLLARREIPAEEVRGEQRWPLEAGNHRLEIPGYSFRLYRIRHGDDTAALFEPVKLHFSAELPAGMRLYFRVRPGEQAVLAGKYHGGIRRLDVERLSDGLHLELPLDRTPERPYWHSDRLELPVSRDEEIWCLRPLGRGKAAFWLDGSANLFAQRPEHLFSPELPPGEVNLELHAEVLGPTPRLGVGLPYTPPEAPQLLARLAPRAANYYSFVNVTSRNPQHEQRFRPLYHHRFGIHADTTLLAQSGRRPVLAADPDTRAGLLAWLQGMRELDGGGTHYLAFADEPNLNYPDYPSFARYFAAMVEELRRFPDAYEAGIRIAAPASSRLLDGPTTDGARSRRGLDWARRLLDTYGEHIDALAWHEWMIRDLRDTRVYRDNVRQAAQLVGLDERGRPRKALLLEQTNLSSGGAVSPYEQETRFAALWWASVAVNTAQDGLLEMLNWFPAFDEEDHLKGMIGLSADGRHFLKPVGQAMVFMQQHWLDEVLRLDNDAFEVDVLAMRTGQRIHLFGVNKTAREQQVRLRGHPLNCHGPEPPRLRLLTAAQQQVEGRLDCGEPAWHFTLPGESLFVLGWTQP
nr:hypothetical protein [Gammaproteobacteria bacterium]